MDENGSTVVPIPREGPLDEDEASSLTAWAQGYWEVRKNLRDSVTGRGYYEPESSRPKKGRAKKPCSRRNHRDDTEISAHTVPRQSEKSQHRTCYWSRVEKTHSLLPLPTTWTYGERVSESSTKGHSPIFSQEFLFARRCLCAVA